MKELGQKLKDSYPNAQILLTTNSPFFLQGLLNDDMTVIKVTTVEGKQPKEELAELDFDNLTPDGILECLFNYDIVPTGSRLY